MSFRTKLIASILLIQIILLLALSWTSLEFLRSSNQEKLQEQVNFAAASFAALAKTSVLTTDIAALESLAKTVLKEHHLLFVSIETPSHGILVKVGDDDYFTQHLADEASGEESDDDLLEVYHEITEAGVSLGRVEVGLSLSSFDALMDKARGRIALIVIVGIVVTGLLCFLIGTYLTRQLRALAEGSQRIAGGDFDYRVPVKGQDELGATATAFNMMSAEIRRMNGEWEAALHASEINQKKTAKSEERVRTILEGTTDAYIELDNNYHITYLNPRGERLMGINKKAALHCKLWDMCPTIAGECREVMECAMREQVQAFHEFYFESAQEWLEVNVYPFRNRLTIFLRVITARKLAEEKSTAALIQKLKAESANKSKSQFLANMSHELRTPLNAILGYSEMLQEDLEPMGHEQHVEDVKKIQAAGKNLLNLINEILDLSKIEAGGIELDLEAVEVAPLICEVVSTIEPMVKKNGNRLTVHCAPDLPPLLGDRMRMRQIVLNLLSNAAKFTENGTIELKVNGTQHDGAEWVEIDVSDSGIGMSLEYLEKLFEPFMQADSATTRKYGGTGLGLTISKRFCEMMGGTIAVTSSPGKGSTFTICLPVASVQAEESPEVPGSVEEVPAVENRRLSDVDGKPERRSHTSTVLVIDDDPNMRALMARHFSKEGFNVILANNGEEGLRVAREKRPDVITLDIMMPKMDGWQMLTQIKADPELTHIQVIVISIVSDSNMGYTLGAADYLVKPVDWNKLDQVVKKWARKAVARILIIDSSHELQVTLVDALLTQGWVIDEADTYEQAAMLASEYVPAVILAPLVCQGASVVDFIAELEQSGPAATIPVVVLSDKELSDAQRNYLSASVQRVIELKGCTQEQILQQVLDQVNRQPNRTIDSPRRAAG